MGPFETGSQVTRSPLWRPADVIYWQPENANVAAVTLVPGVAVRFVLLMG